MSAAFAQLLLASLDEDAEREEAWAAETERRLVDIESGAVQAIPMADALAQVRASLSLPMKGDALATGRNVNRSPVSVTSDLLRRLAPVCSAD